METWQLLAIIAAGLWLLSKGPSMSSDQNNAGGRTSDAYIYAHLVGKGGNCSNLAKFRPIYQTIAARHNLDWKWLAAQGCIESGYNPQALSIAGAAGIAQIMPATGRGMGMTVAPGVQYRGREFPVTMNPARDERFDPAKAIDVQARLLKRWLRKYDNDIAKAFGAYRSGPGNIDRRGLSEGDRRYVSRISARYAQL